MFIRGISVDAGHYLKIVLRVSELDSPVVKPLGLSKKKKNLQELSTSARNTEHKLDPRSLERSFVCASTSSDTNYARPLAKMMPSTLSQLFAPDSVEIVTNLDIQNTRPRCTSPPCPSHDACGLKDKNPELKEKISGVRCGPD